MMTRSRSENGLACPRAREPMTRISPCGISTKRSGPAFGAGSVRSTEVLASAIIVTVNARSLAAVRQTVAGVLDARPEVLAGYVFGSVASGRARPNSDVDVAVLVKPAVMARARSTYRLRLMADLGEALRTFNVDVVLLNAAPPALAQNVIAGGVLVSERSRGDRVRFQVETLNRFLDTQRMRDLYLGRLKRRYAGVGARG